MKYIKAKHSAFSLVEMMISIMIFTVIILVALAVFLRVSSLKSKTGAIQRNLEDARYALDLMAKTMRTSSVVDPTPDVINARNGQYVSLVKIFDYSQSLCIEYEFSVDGKLTEKTIGQNKVADCDAYDMSGETAYDVIANYVSGGKFYVIPSSTGVAGRITVVMKVCDTQNCVNSQDNSTIQTTVSLRDYDIQSP